MSFTVSTRRPRGLGASPFISTLTVDAGAAIHEAVRSGRFNSEAFTPTVTPGAPDYGSAPSATSPGSDLSCDCLAKRALEALVNVGADPSTLGSLGDAIAECEADPDAFYATIAGFFPGGEVPECAWYEERTKRNYAIAAGAAVLLLGVGGVALVRRRRR